MCGCAANKKISPTDIVNAQADIPEQELLDVGVQIFDPGEISSEPEDTGILPEIRKTESRFFANHLKNTLQKTGQWGAVRVIPSESDVIDVHVNGEIVESNGDVLVLKIKASDATGKIWFERTYEAEADGNSYKEIKKVEKDAFQDLYNTVANDLVRARKELPSSERRKIRIVSQLKFASDLAPDAFGDYLRKSDDGLYTINHLPAANDALMNRVLNVREREYMLVDTINGYYDQFYYDIWESYENWRKSHREELLAMRKVEASARNRYMLGAAAIAGAIALEVLSSGRTSTARNVMVLGGAAAIKSGFDRSADAKIHEEAIREMDDSFEAEVAPMVLDIEGHTVELTGSAEEQYQAWRQLIREIYITETGFQINPAASPNAAPNPSVN